MITEIANFISFDNYNLSSTFILSMGIQTFFLLFAVIFKTDKLTDLIYGSTFILLSAFVTFKKQQITTTDYLLFAAVTLWGLRLAFYLFYRILKIGRDNRFNEIRNSVVKFTGFWIFQGLTVFFIFSPMAITATRQTSINLVTLSIGLLIFAIGLLIEAVADWQKFKFKRKPENRGEFISTGLWAYSRHPNYFGEVLVWYGLFIVCLPYLSGILYISVVGPIFITLILLFFSGIPLLEKAYDERYKDRQDYQDYKIKTRKFFLLPRWPSKNSYMGS